MKRLLLVLVLSWPTVGLGDFAAGLAAAQRGDFKTAMREWKPLAEQGYADAQFNLGLMYSNGRGVPQDYAAAMKWYRLAGEQGVAQAQFLLGIMYDSGMGIAKDYAEALKWYRLAGEQGYAVAQYRLGLMYEVGNGVRQNYVEAIKWIGKAAVQGHAPAQWVLGVKYVHGRGVPQDYTEAIRWLGKAAVQGYANAQHSLSLMYSLGEGVPQDYVRAYAWSSLAAAQGLKGAAKLRELDRRRMTRSQVTEGQRLSRKLAAQFAASKGLPKPAGTPKHTPPTAAPRPVASGSGFVVSAAGDLLTNYHVVKDCSKVTASPSGNGKATRAMVSATDKLNDLATLKLPGPLGQAETGLLAAFQSNNNVARFRASRRARLGEPIMVAGFPLKGLLSQGLNVTTGTVTSLAGVGDDARMLQISAPVQAGNSGGPLLDASGNVIGIVVSKLKALTVRRLTGDLAQNVNFAIKGAVVRSFLDIHGIEYQTARSLGKLDNAAIAEKAHGFTVALECWK